MPATHAEKGPEAATTSLLQFRLIVTIWLLFLNPSNCRFEGKVPAVHAEKGAEAAAELGQQVGPLVDAYVACLEARKIKDGIRHVMAISSVGESTARLLQVLYCSNNLLSISRSSAINSLTSHLWNRCCTMLLDAVARCC